MNLERLQWEYDEGRITAEEFSKKLAALRKYKMKKYEHFEVINKSIIADPAFCKKFRGPIMLYLYLRTLVIRTGPLRHRTYGKDALLSLVSQDKCAEHFGVSVRTIQNWLGKLVNEGMIKKAKLNVYGKGKDYQPNLYQVGYINKKGREDYFIDKGYF
jgi:hypothetical protein